MNFFDRLLQHRREQADVVRHPYTGDLKGLPFPMTRERKAILRSNAAPIYFYGSREVADQEEAYVAVQGHVAR